MTAHARYFEVNAFTNSLRGGNPAGVCLLEGWLPDDVLLAIAAQNNLSETAFLVREPARDATDVVRSRIRWFTPTVEVNLCGHATLASGHVLFNELGVAGDVVELDSRSGLLRVRREGDWLELEFPLYSAEPCEAPRALLAGLRADPKEVHLAAYYLAVFDSEKEIREIAPDFPTLAQITAQGIIVTAPGDSCDFVSRFFAPAVGINEDPVTGSAHCTLVPYWAKRLGRNELQARQISARGGELQCRLKEDRVFIAGQTVRYLKGEIALG